MSRHAVVMYSSGVGSWAAARATVAELGAGNVTLLFADTSTEDADNYRFLRETVAQLGAELVTLKDGRGVWDVFSDERMIGNTRLSVCSRALKQRPARSWLEANADPATTTVVVGIDWTEAHRLTKMRASYQPFTVQAPLCDPPYLERDQIFADLAALGIEPPRLYAMGFAHANCGGFCVRAGQGQFAQLLALMPERYAWHEQREQEIRQQLGKDVAILRDRRGGTTKPLTLTVLRQRIEQNGEVDQLDLGGCGCFVDEQ